MPRTRRKAPPDTEPTFVNADARPEPPDPATLVLVYPSPDLPTGSFLPGVGAAGATVTPDLADEWIAAGLATTTPPAPPVAEPEG